MDKQYFIRDFEEIPYSLLSGNENNQPSRILPVDQHVFLTSSNILAKKSSGIGTMGFNSLETLQNIEMIKEHKTLITCIGTNKEGWLICSCSEQEVILSKWDSVLNVFTNCTIAEDLGKIFSCDVTIKENKVWTGLSQASELTVLESLSEDPFLNEAGQLSLISHEFIGTLDKLPQPCTWVKFVELDALTYVVGISSGNSVSVKMWEFSGNQFLLKGHYLTALNKVFSSADMKEDKASGNVYLVIAGGDGNAEAIRVTKGGFMIVNKFKITDSGFDMLSAGDSIQVEFRVLCAKLYFNQDDGTGFNVTDGDVDDFYDNNLDFREHTLLFPKLLIVVITTKGISILNVLNGELEFNCCFEELEILSTRNSALVSKARVHVCDDSEMIVVLQPLFQNKLLTFKIKLKIEYSESKDEEANDNANTLKFQATKPLNRKTVLRKKLKSPPRPKPSLRRSSIGPTPNKLDFSDRFDASHLLPDKSKWKRKESFVCGKTVNPTTLFGNGDGGSPNGPAWSRRNTVCLATSNTSVLKNLGKFKSSNGQVLKSATDEGGLSSSSTVRIQPISTYSKFDISFSESHCKILTTRLADFASYSRMKFSCDGKYLAVGGNSSPLVLFETVPNFREIVSYRDIQYVTSLDFAFSTKHLLVGTNDGQTEIRDWAKGKSLLKFSFNSKFNEHIHSQFYYMDKFILQPENNCISLYSYRYKFSQNPELYLKAGSFPLDAQKITAIAAVNKFYSRKQNLWNIECACIRTLSACNITDLIVSGCSNKTLQVFDANAETVILTLKNAHARPISCIRINESPEGYYANSIGDLFLTSAPTTVDPIKLWDLRVGKCVTKIADISSRQFCQTSRPSLSPCGRYIASGFEENMIGLYDIRKIDSRIGSLKVSRSSILDISFDPNYSMLWCACRNGNLLLYNGEPKSGQNA